MAEVPRTTAQALGSLIKSARDIMRKDKGLNGDLDRLPLLTWIMFLKFLDDLEQQREDEAKLAAKSSVPPSSHLIDGGTGRQSRKVLPAMSFFPSSIRMKPRA